MFQVENTEPASGVISSEEVGAGRRAGFERAFRALEFDKILELLCDCTPVEGAKELLSALVPSVSPDRIRQMLTQTSEAKMMAAAKGAPSFGGVQDIRASVKRCAKGAVLTMAELLKIAGVLHAARSIADYFSAYQTEQPLCLSALSDTLSPNKFLEEMITDAILSEDAVADSASGELYDIRRKIRAASAKIREVLQKYVSGGGSKYLQENIITTRGGRFVIPVKAEYRSEVKGLLHDTSATGSTLFIEPMSVVEANNEIRALEAKEKAEIERILAALSTECGRFADALQTDYQTLCALAAVFAKAELSFRMDAAEPVLSKKPYVELKRARHPLLDRSKVVPIDVTLGRKYTMLVITGPNTGGKTVTLKTLGLFAMMAQCGLHIPAADGSILPVFDSVLADIGDEQSIEQSLSTFSAHMVNIVAILKKITPRSLVLFDELGAGTDPLEGAALAEAILETVRKTGCLCAATTHYAELKAYALSTDGVSNALCEFDVETLRPTYRLIIGLPGRSNAFAIAERLGIPQAVVNAAKENMSGETLRFESLIDELETQKSYYESERKKAEELRASLSEMHRKTREERERFNKRLESENERAEKQARALIEQARASANFIFSELDRVKKQKDSEDFAAQLAKAKQDVKEKLSASAAGRAAGLSAAADDEDYVLPRPLKKGDTVMLRDFHAKGTVLSVNGDEATVQAGIIKTKTKISNLRLEELPAADRETKIRHAVSTGASLSVKTEIDVRGMIGDDAWLAVDKYLDEAVLANLSQVTIIHGKGTGALRNALTGFLRRDRRVKSFRAGMYGEGDAGVTVVTLA